MYSHKTKCNATVKNEAKGLQQRRPCLNTVDGDNCTLKNNVQNLENKLKIARNTRIMNANFKLTKFKKSNVKRLYSSDGQIKVQVDVTGLFTGSSYLLVQCGLL